MNIQIYYYYITLYKLSVEVQDEQHTTARRDDQGARSLLFSGTIGRKRRVQRNRRGRGSV